MPAYKDENKGTWYASFYYENWKGERLKKMKRGFKTKREAETFIAHFKMEQSKDLNMNFEEFVKIYVRDLSNRIKENTMLTKRYIIEDKILPYFKLKQINDISVADIIEWQNQLLAYRNENDEPYSPCYLKTVHNQVSAIFNHAVKYYSLKSNPARMAGNMGKEKTKEMKFWTKDEYLKFSESMMRKDGVYQAFEVLYWCGLRLGELLALTPSDFNFTQDTIRINKSLQRLKGKNVITELKTMKSIRTVKMPHFLAEEMQDYIHRLYGIKRDTRIFNISKSGLHHEMDRGCKETGTKRIRIHDLRHSHVSLLIELGFSAVAIADCVGHESIDITYRYAHLFPAKGKEIANKLDEEREEAFDVTEEQRLSRTLAQ